MRRFQGMNEREESLMRLFQRIKEREGSRMNPCVVDITCLLQESLKYSRFVVGRKIQDVNLKLSNDLILRKIQNVNCQLLAVKR